MHFPSLWLKVPEFILHLPVFIIAVIFLLSISAYPLSAQDSEMQVIETDTLASGDRQLNRAVSVYIDCQRTNCDYDHIRREIRFVNYVRDRELADIHIFVTSTSTGTGGREYEFSFIGRGVFSDMDFTLIYVADRNNTWDETREGMNRMLEAGLMPYASQTPLISRFSFQYDSDLDLDDSQFVDAVDPWDYWVFEAYIGSVRLQLESNRTNFSSRWGIFADRVTEEWKLRIRPYFNYSLVEVQREDAKDVHSTTRRHGLDTHAIKSLGDHWSAGLFGTYITRNDRNIRHRFQLNPGVEYSLFPYDVATRRAITFRYQTGYTYIDYFEETIYGQGRENLLNQSLEASVSFQQPWGQVAGGIVGSHYFHDFSFRRAEVFARLSLRITEGLSLSIQSDLEMIQDQITLPAGDATLEEILLRQRELATDFYLSGSVAITYTFGSSFVNIVNTRF